MEKVIQTDRQKNIIFAIKLKREILDKGRNINMNQETIEPVSLNDQEDHEDAPIKTVISSKRQRRMQYRIQGGLSAYRKEMSQFLVTTRFNQHTWNENVNYKKKHSLPDTTCIYASPQATSREIPDNAIVFVLEMNNDTNQILGIGMVRNHTYIKQHRIYSNENYNRYSYLGKYHIDRSEMTEQEELVMKVFDILCFTGSRHMKRLQGMKLFPIDMLYNTSKILDLHKYIREMFKQRLQETN